MNGQNPIFIDIDGTLTHTPNRAHGEPILHRIAHVRTLIEAGVPVVLWSWAGTEYARNFAMAHKLEPLACIGKPKLCVDDVPSIVPGRLKVSTPRAFFLSMETNYK